MIPSSTSIGKKVVIVPIGDVRSGVIFEISRVLREMFGMHVYVSRARAPSPASWFRKFGDIHKNFIDGDRALSHLSIISKLANIGTDHTIGITEHELGNQRDGTAMHGYASLQHPVGIVSIHYMGFDIFTDGEAWTNLLKVVVHEIGHTFGIPHCPNDCCIMHSVGEEGLVALEMSFCLECLEILGGRRTTNDKKNCEMPTTKERN